MKGKLYLIPTFLSETRPENVFPQLNTKIIYSLDIFIVEELKTARRFLRKVGFKKPFEEVTLHLLNEHTDLSKIGSYLDEAENGRDIGLFSEAGTPCIADPGSGIVKIAHKRNIRVVPLTGPSSIMLALMASGFNGQNFAFAGYLPIDKKQAANRIKEIEKKAWHNDQTQIFIETPYRNNRLFDILLNTCSDDTLLCIASGLTSENEFIKTLSVGDWKKQKPELHKIPAVFLMYKNGS
jgi:16S rRNA (cytidine1402-2'-O)-methyltransferase